jgi:hypothetical protein
MIPVLLHKLSNATQLLSSLNALLSIEGGAELALSRADDMARTSSQVEDLGWLLAALASASGADLLMERRERRGLAIFLGVLRDALRRRGSELHVETREIPGLSNEALGGWELPWVLSSLVLDSASATGQGASLVLRCAREEGTNRQCFDLAGGKPASEAAIRLMRRLPGAELFARADGFALRVPSSWLSAPEP